MERGKGKKSESEGYIYIYEGELAREGGEMEDGFQADTQCIEIDR